MFRRAFPAPVRTAELNSFTAQMSPAFTSKPAATIRCRASTPASNHVRAGSAATHACQPVTLISAIACICGPSARIAVAWLLRRTVLSAASGGTET
jgi:hypothetical protein